MSENQVTYPVATMCRLLGVFPSGYYAWRTRGPSDRDLSDEWLLARIRHHHERSDGTYGAPRIHRELRAEGIYVGKKRVARLLRQAGIQGVSRRRGFRTTQKDPQARPHEDLVERNFTAPGPADEIVTHAAFSQMDSSAFLTTGNDEVRA